MKEATLLFLVLFSFFATSFEYNTMGEENAEITAFDKTNMPSTDNWYICSYCCKTKKATSRPHEQGCKVSSSGTHNFQFSGKAGTVKHICKKCDAELYLKQGTGPSASKCCATGGTHTWSYR